MQHGRQNGTQARIDVQRGIVASLVPGSPEHELATRVLLLLQDSLHLHQQIDELMAAARRMQSEASG